MLTVSWSKTTHPYVLQLNALGLFWALLIDVPEGMTIGEYLRGTVKVPEAGSTSVEDDNSISWGPSLEPDNWCQEPRHITGEYLLQLKGRQALDMACTWNASFNAYTLDAFWQATIADRKCSYTSGGTRNECTWLDDTLFRKETYDRKSGIYLGYTIEEIEFIPRGYKIHHMDFDSHGSKYNDWSWTQNWTNYVSARTKPMDISAYKSNYSRLIGYVCNTFDLKIRPTLRTNVHDWVASLDATEGFHPYDINLVEGILNFGMEDLFPKGTSSKVLDILESAVASKGGLFSPKGLLAAAQIFGNIYLYYKYVFAGDASDISEIVLGTDKPMLIDTVTSIVKADPDYRPREENQKLLTLAQRIVHKGGRLLSAYGTSGFSEPTILGEMTYRSRARLRAYPKYLEDMSAASIIIDEIGLSLSFERLAAVVPYEFVAEWFLPIEETIRSIEKNADRLGQMYTVENLCISHKTEIDLDDNYLLAMFGLSQAVGHLKFKDYSRSSSDKFPPTAPDLSLRPKASLSRVLQGSSLIITKL